MCGFAGFLDFKMNYLNSKNKWDQILTDMCKKLYHRGPDEQDYVLTEHYGLAHTRLSIIDLLNGKQPMTLHANENTYRIVYNGELYNTKELRPALKKYGWEFSTTSDTEVILVGFAQFGEELFPMLNGIFSFFVISEKENLAYLVRDQIGVKPLYYSVSNNTIIFSSEIKGIFCHPKIKPELSTVSLNEVLSLGPAKTYGSGVFKGINEVKPGHFIKIKGTPSTRSLYVTSQCYWKLKAEYYEQSYEDTVEHTRFLVSDAIKRQMVSDVPIATFLSGGIDSSIVSSVCAKELEHNGQRLGTFSFEFKDNNKFFKSNSFQPSLDRPYVDIMKDYLNSIHYYLECDNSVLYDNLFASVDMRDLPTMADVDSSMLYFCRLVKPYYKVVLTGECADEIFGGYPWFHKKECFEADTFPWSMDISARKAVLKDDIINELDMERYISSSYHGTISETPALEGESKEEARRREITYLNMKWFMQTLLDRMDRTSMCSGLEARVPFADVRIVEFLYNVPWKYKCKNNVEKSLLRDAMSDYLPPEILGRKKSPYPKTYDPNYEKLLADSLLEVINTPSSPINSLVDKKKVLAFIKKKKDYGKPWYGQLMAGPQMLAYLLQMNYWLDKYKISL